MTTTPDHNAATPHIDHAAILEKLGEGVLIFGADDKLLLDNHVARKILGSNMVVIRQQGWPAFALIVDRDQADDVTADSLRAKSLRQTDPVRFRILVADAYVPCWLSAVHQEDVTPLTIVTLEQADWTPIHEFMANMRKEGTPAIEDTLGHAKFMIQIAKRTNEKTKVPQLAGQMQRFATLIHEEMEHLQILLRQMHRLEEIRTGNVRQAIAQQRKRVDLEDFFEDFLEELSEEYSKRDGQEDKDVRDRINMDIDADLYIDASVPHMETVIHDVLNNALLYSKPDSPLQIRAFATNQRKSVQINVIDEGIGIRESEYDRVFTLFKRARQPQVIAEFGFGVSLALVKSEMEAMNGRIWFNSEEKVGTIFSLKFPAHIKSDPPPATTAADTEAETQSTTPESTPKEDTTPQPPSS
jgi:signal transduction histidine kinase